MTGSKGDKVDTGDGAGAYTDGSDSAKHVGGGEVVQQYRYCGILWWTNRCQQ